MPEAATTPMLRVLLVNAGPAWRAAVEDAADTIGLGRIDVVPRPAEAARKLMAVGARYSHVLLDMTSSPEWIAVFAGLTIGEADTATALVRLGGADDMAAAGPIVPEPDPAVLAKVLLATAPKPSQAHMRPLSNIDIMGALREGHIVSRFQPIVRFDNHRLAGFEVLARYDHPIRGTLPPSLFVPQMEGTGQSLQLADAVFQRCLDSIDIGFLTSHDLFVSINLPLDALLLPQSLVQIEARRQQSGLAAHRVLIELTESRPVHDIPALGVALERWRAIGYRLAIDDMGPDVVNQTVLLDMPFHTVKLDKNIVLRSRTDALARRYLQRAVENAQARSLTIIAEGIEDELMWDRMAELGVDYAQGFMIARGLPAAAVPVWIDIWNERSAGQAFEPA